MAQWLSGTGNGTTGSCPSALPAPLPCFFAAGRYNLNVLLRRRPGPRGAQFNFLSAFAGKEKSTRPSHNLSYQGFKSTEYYFPLGKISAGRPIQAFLPTHTSVHLWENGSKT